MDEERVPGKSDGPPREEIAVSVKYAFISSEEGNIPISSMCRLAKMSRSGYYEWVNRARFTEQQYNQKRLNSALGYQTPNEVGAASQARNLAA
ncbi:MAG: hypothetical protein QM630_04195 [Microbacterium sp.]